jgi:hypothetical protein
VLPNLAVRTPTHFPFQMRPMLCEPVHGRKWKLDEWAQVIHNASLVLEAFFGKPSWTVHVRERKKNIINKWKKSQIFLLSLP